MGNPSKAKGYRGEKEVLDMLQSIVNEEYRKVGVPPPELARSANGRDIRGLPWIALEVKRRENDGSYQMREWWEQTKKNSPDGHEPVLIWRKNFEPWRIRMFGYIAAGTESRVRCPVDITLEAFLAYFRAKLRSEFKLTFKVDQIGGGQ